MLHRLLKEKLGDWEEVLRFLQRVFFWRGGKQVVYIVETETLPNQAI